MYIYSAVNNAFYPLELEKLYRASDSWPNDGIKVSEDVFLEFSDNPPEGKQRVANKRGEPCWDDIPPLSKKELIEVEETKRKKLIDDTNIFINTKQWPSKLALGRLTDLDKSEFNKWLDYIDALEEIDVSNAPDIEWPTKPVN